MVSLDQFLTAANTDLGLGTPVDINSPLPDTGGYSASLPDWSSAVPIAGASPGSTPDQSSGGWQGFLNGLLSYSLAKDKINAQAQVATAARTVAPAYGGQLMPAGAGGMNIQGLLVIGALLFVGLHFAKGA